MPKFKEGDFVLIHNQKKKINTVYPNFFGGHAPGYVVEGSSGIYEERKLTLCSHSCPVCDKDVEIKDNKIAGHGQPDNLCYGSFMPI